MWRKLPLDPQWWRVVPTHSWPRSTIWWPSQSRIASNWQPNNIRKLFQFPNWRWWWCQNTWSWTLPTLAWPTLPPTTRSHYPTNKQSQVSCWTWLESLLQQVP
jgi:hypothetical protein